MKRRRKRGITRLEKKVLEILYFTSMDYSYTQTIAFTLVDLVDWFERAYPNYYKDTHVCYCTLRRLINQLYRKGLIEIVNEEEYRKEYRYYLPTLILSSRALQYCEEQKFTKFSPSLHTENKLDSLPDHLRRIV